MIMSANFGVNEAHLTLVKADGTRVDTEGTLNPDMVIVEEDVPVDVGDHFEHVRPSGVVARFAVLSVYHSSVLNHYQCKVKPAAAVRTPAASSIAVGDIVVRDARHVVVQVGHDLSTEPSSSPATRHAHIDMADVREHLLTLLDQDIATKKVLWDLSGAQDEVRRDLSRLLDALAKVTRGVAVTEVNARAMIERAAEEAAKDGALSPSLSRWALSNPVTHNLIASLIVEALKGA